MPLLAFSEMLKSGMLPASDVEKHNEYHGLIHESAQHLLQVLNDILDMSKMEAGKYEIYPEAIELNQIIKSCKFDDGAIGPTSKCYFEICFE